MKEPVFVSIFFAPVGFTIKALDRPNLRRTRQSAMKVATIGGCAYGHPGEPTWTAGDFGSIWSSQDSSRAERPCVRGGRGSIPEVESSPAAVGQVRTATIWKCLPRRSHSKRAPEGSDGLVSRTINEDAIQPHQNSSGGRSNCKKHRPSDSKCYLRQLFNLVHSLPISTRTSSSVIGTGSGVTGISSGKSSRISW